MGRTENTMSLTKVGVEEDQGRPQLQSAARRVPCARQRRMSQRKVASEIKKGRMTTRTTTLR